MNKEKQKIITHLVKIEMLLKQMLEAMKEWQKQDLHYHERNLGN